MRNFNQAADNNKRPICEKLQALFAAPGRVLEIASGSGQHAIHMSSQLPHLTWQPTEQTEMLEPLKENVSKFTAGNVLEPVELEVSNIWPAGSFSYAYAANLLHIMSEPLMPVFFERVSQRLVMQGLCVVYGPFRYGGCFTTESNARFDVFLRGTYPHGGIRDFEKVCDVAGQYGFSIISDFNMPANNQLLVFRQR